MAAAALLPPAAPPSSPPLPTTAFRLRDAALRGLASISTMPELQQRHSQLVRVGLSDDNDAAGRLLRFLTLSPTGDLRYALRLFHHLPHPDPFIYNTLLRSLPSPDSSLLYSHMLLSSLHPNSFTFPSLLKSISAARDANLGEQIHAHVVKLGYHRDAFAQNSLIHMYLTCGLLSNAKRVFNTMQLPDVISYTTLITGCSKLGLIDDARKLFDEMPERSSVSWNAMIAGYAQNDRFNDAFELFDRMGAVELNKFVAASMVSACTGLGALERGRRIHERVIESGIELDPKLATTIIDMYCKCGCLETARDVFDGLPRRELSSWNCMIGGLATHGQGRAAIEMFKEMEKEMVVPDAITLLNVLTACAHAGLVDEGRHYFEYMVQVYGIKPKMEHFGCMVDLLGRAGLLEEARKVIDEMPIEPDAGVLGALVGACRIHGKIDLGEEIGRRAIELEPQNSGRYVVLANLFASTGRWDDVAEVRRLMNDRGVKKQAGCSMIEMDGAVYDFIAGGRSHPQARKIYEKIDEMLQKIRADGYLPDTDGVLYEIDDEEKENPLYYHSEKLAIAFGLLNTVQGETIRISKNLRVCRDCHEASKLISRVYDREIVVRDRNRFHHFKGGHCSCKDYW